MNDQGKINRYIDKRTLWLLSALIVVGGLSAKVWAKPSKSTAPAPAWNAPSASATPASAPTLGAGDVSPSGEAPSDSAEKKPSTSDDEPVIGKNALRVDVAVPVTFKIVRGMYLAFLPRYKKESIFNVGTTEDPAFELMFLRADAKTEEQKSRYKFKTIDRFNKNFVDEEEGQIIKSVIVKAPKKEKMNLFRFNKDAKTADAPSGN